MSNTITNNARFKTASYGNAITNTVEAEIVNFNAIKKQNNITTPINIQNKNIITYSFSFTNPTSTVLTNTLFKDTINNSLTYQVGTFKLNNVVVTPTISGNNLSYIIASIAANTTITLEFSVLVN